MSTAYGYIREYSYNIINDEYNNRIKLLLAYQNILISEFTPAATAE